MSLRTPSRMDEPLPTAAALVLLVIAVVMVTLRLTSGLAAPGSDEGTAGDFRDATYLPVRAVLDGIDPYDPAAYLASDPDIGQYLPLYAPHHLLIHLPLAPLSLNGAIAAYAVITLLLTIALARVGLGLAGLDCSATMVMATAALLLLSNPGRGNFVNLQPTLIIVLGAYLALSQRANPWPAGAGLALAWLKPQFGLPLVVILFLTGRAAVALRGTLLAAAASAPIVARLVDIEGGAGGLFDAVRDNLRAAGDIGPSYLQVDLVGSLGISSLALSLGVTAVVLAAAVTALRRDGSAGAISPSGLTITAAAVLLGLFHVNYDLLLLTWPALALAAVVSGGDRRPLTLTLTGAVFLLGFNPLTSSFAIQRLAPSAGLAALSACLLLGVFGLSILLHRRSTPPPFGRPI